MRARAYDAEEGAARAIPPAVEGAPHRPRRGAPRWHMHALDAGGTPVGREMRVPGRGDLAAALAEMRRQWRALGSSAFAVRTRSVAITEGPGGPEVARVPVRVPTRAEVLGEEDRGAGPP